MIRLTKIIFSSVFLFLEYIIQLVEYQDHSDGQHRYDTVYWVNIHFVDELLEIYCFVMDLDKIIQVE
ncbi:MAG: hypothetical protein K0Q81_1419 [Paenibacillus sp.]|jgi:hypothetical protein|nr:hypothetical protein [Paenibacillus sp.]